MRLGKTPTEYVYDEDLAFFTPIDSSWAWSCGNDHSQKCNVSPSSYRGCYLFKLRTGSYSSDVKLPFFLAKKFLGASIK